MLKKSPRWILWLAVASTILVYFPLLRAPYYFDDLQAFGGDLNDVEFPRISNLTSPQQRPLLQLFFGAISSVSESPILLYRISGVLIHLLNGLLIWKFVSLVVVQLSEGFADKKRDEHRFETCSPWVAIWITSLWLLHPMAVQTVGSIVQQSESLMTSCLIGYLLVIASLRRGGIFANRAWISAVTTCALLFIGIYLKVVIVVAVPAGILLDALLSRTSICSIVKEHGYIHLPPIIGSMVVAFALVPMLLRAEGGIGFGGDAPPLYIYVLTSARSFIQYLGLTIWPMALSIDRAPHWIRMPWEALPWLIALAGYCLVAIRLWLAPVSNWQNRMLGFVLFMPLVILMPTSTIIPTADSFFEHRFYFALLFVIWAIVWPFAYAYKHFQEYRSSIVCLGFFFLLALSVRTYVRIKDFRSLDAIWRSALQVDPDNARAAQNFVTAFQVTHHKRDFLAELENLRFYAVQRGLPHDAIKHQLAKAYLQRGEVEIASRLLLELSKSIPRYDDLFTDRQRREYGERAFDLALLFVQRNMLESAMEGLEYVLKCTPNDPFALALAGDVSIQLNRRDDARAYWVRALEFGNEMLPNVEEKLQQLEAAILSH